MPTPFRTIADVQAANAAIGHNFFAPETMAFFDSIIGSRLYHGTYFITSERYDENSPRLFTVHRVNPCGSIETVGKFQGYATFAQARARIRELEFSDFAETEA